MNTAEYVNIAKYEREFWWYRGMEEILFRMLDPIVSAVRARDVLETGCGTGYNASRFAIRYGWRMFPTDLQHEGLLYARAEGVQRIAQADMAALPFADNTFDAVVSLDAMVYLPRGEEGSAVSEMTRVLAPGGLLIIRTAALEIMRSDHARFTGERQRYTRGHLLQLAVKNGIKVLRCSYSNFLLMPVALVKFRLMEPLAGGKPSSGVEPVSPWLDRLLLGALHCESWWLGRRNLPIGQSLILIGEKAA